MTLTARLRRYGGSGRRMTRIARLKLSGSPRSTWLHLAMPSGDARLGCTGVGWSARLHLTRPDARLHRTGARSSARLHLSGPAGYARSGLRRDESEHRPASGRAGRGHRAAVVRVFPWPRGLQAAPPGRVSPVGSVDSAATAGSAPAVAASTAWWPWTVTPPPGLRPSLAGPPAAAPWGFGSVSGGTFCGAWMMLGLPRFARAMLTLVSRWAGGNRWPCSRAGGVICLDLRSGATPPVAASRCGSW